MSPAPKPQKRPTTEIGLEGKYPCQLEVETIEKGRLGMHEALWGKTAADWLG
jgi:hypothetical protein